MYAWWKLEMGFNLDDTIVNLWIYMEYVFIGFQNSIIFIINVFWKESLMLTIS